MTDTTTMLNLPNVTQIAGSEYLWVSQGGVDRKATVSQLGGSPITQGIFTPSIAFGGNSVGVTYSQQVGAFIKIGNSVNVQIRLILSNKGSSVGIATVQGLPYAANLTLIDVMVLTGRVNNSTFPGSPIPAFATSLNAINLSYFNAGNLSNIDDTMFMNNTNLTISGVYFTS